jgi:acetylornithine aminotransferase
LTESQLITDSLEKEELFRELLVHPLIEEVRGKGLMLAVILSSEEIANELVLRAQEKGLILFWLLFEKRAVRITPPLTISKEDVKKGCGTILEILSALQ